MSFTVEEKPLMKCLHVSKGYLAASLCKMYLDNTQTFNIDGIKCLNTKIDMTGSIKPFD